MLSRRRSCLLATTLILVGLFADSSAGFQDEPEGGNAIVFKSKFGSPGGPAEGGLNYPTDVAVDRTTGDIFVADNAAFVIQKYDRKGDFLRTIGTPGTSSGHDADGQLYYPNAIAIDSLGVYLYVADTFNSRIQVFSATDGAFVRKWGTEGDPLNHPTGIALDAQDNVYVTDTRNHRVMKYSSTGTFIKKWGAFGNGLGNFNTPVGIDVAGSNVFITEDVGRFQQFDLDGNFIAEYGVGHLTNPDEIAVEKGSGNPGHAYVIESGGSEDGHEVSVFDVSGTSSGSETFVGEFKGTEDPRSDYGFSPRGIALHSDPDAHELFVAAGGAVGAKIFRYNTRAKAALRVRRKKPTYENQKLFFTISHNMMVGNCFVKGEGVLETPQEDPFFDGERFPVKGNQVRVAPKKSVPYAIEVSDRAARAINKTLVTAELRFGTTSNFCKASWGLEFPEDVKIRFSL